MCLFALVCFTQATADLLEDGISLSAKDVGV